MPTIVLSCFIILVFFGMGDWLHRMLAGGACRTTAARFVLSAWAGLMLCIAVLTTLYHAIGTVSVGALAWPVTLLFAGVSLVSAWRTRITSASDESFPPGYLLVAAVGFILISSPLLSLTGPGFYSTNPNGVNPNGELINYAAVADVVKHHPLSGAAGFAFPVDSRESVTGILCALFSTLSRTPTVFIVQPLSYALGWLSFATLAILFHRAVGPRPVAVWQDVAMLLTYAAAILSAATQELWTLSFLSQYASIALFFGLLAFLAEYSDRGEKGWIRQAAAIGIAMGTMFCNYPEMFLASLLLFAAFWLFSVRRASQSLTTHFAALVIAVAAAAAVGNKLAFHVLHVFAGGTSALTVTAGWDFLGPTVFRTLAGNLFGLSNLFYAPQPPGLLLVCLVFLAIAAALVHAVRTLFAPSPPVSRGISALLLCYVAASVALFAIVIVQQRETNYLAIKFASGFVWIVYLAAGMALANSRLSSLRVAAIVMWAAVLFRVVLVADAFSGSLDTEGRRALFTEQDARAVRSVVGPAPDVFVAAGLWNLKVVGAFLVSGEDFLHLWSAYPKARMTEFDNQKYILTVGADAVAQAQNRGANYHLLMRRDALTVWARNSGTHEIRSITASSTYGNQSEFAPAEAVDGDEGTSWAAQGSGPATLTMTASQAGTLKSITLVSRGSRLLECWQTVQVTLRLQGIVVSQQRFSLPDASTKRRQEVVLQPARTDSIELSFSDPVTRTMAGADISPSEINPGYAEVLLTWTP